MSAELQSIIRQPSSLKSKSMENLTVNKLRFHSVGLHGREAELSTLLRCLERIHPSQSACSPKNTNTIDDGDKHADERKVSTDNPQDSTRIRKTPSLAGSSDSAPPNMNSSSTVATALSSSLSSLTTDNDPLTTIREADTPTKTKEKHGISQSGCPLEIDTDQPQNTTEFSSEPSPADQHSPRNQLVLPSGDTGTGKVSFKTIKTKQGSEKTGKLCHLTSVLSFWGHALSLKDETGINFEKNSNEKV